MFRKFLPTFGFYLLLQFIVLLSCVPGVILTKENRKNVKTISIKSMVVFATDSIWALSAANETHNSYGGFIGGILKAEQDANKKKLNVFANKMNFEYRRVIDSLLNVNVSESLKKQGVFNLCADSSCQGDAQLLILVTVYGFANWGVYSEKKIQPTLKIHGYLLKNPPLTYTVTKTSFTINKSIKQYGCLTSNSQEKHPVIWDKDILAGWLGGTNSHRMPSLSEFAENLPFMTAAVAEVTNEAITKLFANMLKTEEN